MAQDKKFEIKNTSHGNTNHNGKAGDSKYVTMDKVYISTNNSFMDTPKVDRRKFVTDYARALGVDYNGVMDNFTGNTGMGLYWLRTANATGYVDYIDYEGNILSTRPNNTDIGIAPSIVVDMSAINSNTPLFKYQSRVKGGKDIAVIQLGSYPRNHCVYSDEIEKLFQEGKLKVTGTYAQSIVKYNNSIQLLSDVEVQNEVSGKRYVRVNVSFDSAQGEYRDGSLISEGPTWFEVEPIRWIVDNWEHLPKHINPKSTGNATQIFLTSLDVITGGFPFALKGNRDQYWQNSVVRAYLNGINTNNIQTNGNVYMAGNVGYDFTDAGFLKEAFGDGMMTEAKKVIKSHKKVNPYKFTYEELSNDDLLKMYVRSNTSVFLHGPSGVGKSSRVKQLDPTATKISLRHQMNPEEIDGTLNRDTNEFNPPYWYKELKAKCEAEPDKVHTLFIDELTNVKPAVQSLVYSIVLDRAGKDGMWPLPDNAVVVAAGNETVGNAAAYPMTNALFRRFCHLYYKIDKDEFLDWATGVRNVTPQEYDRAIAKEDGIHPAIIAYITARGEKVLNQDMDEDNPKIVTDPRKWEIASNVLKYTNNPKALQPAIGDELTADFVHFTESMYATIDGIVNGEYDKDDFKDLSISDMLSTSAGLVGVEEDNLAKVRDFISEKFGQEILASFDGMWIRNDVNRALIVDELRRQDVKAEELNSLEG